MSPSRECAAAILRWDERGFLHATYRSGLEMTLEHAVECLRLQDEMMQGMTAPVAVLVDSTRLRSQSKEAREYLGGAEGARLSLAVAVVVGPVSKVIGRFMMRSRKPLYPLELFSDEESAVAWLLAHMRQASNSTA